MLKFHGTSDIKNFVRRHFEGMAGLRGKVVVDLPAGKGYMSRVLRDLGADVRAYDLFPHFFEAEGLACNEADLTEALPIADESTDIVLCQEGIEHLPDQLAALMEFNRILKKDGTLLITTPSISHLRARASLFLSESDLYRRMPPNELDAVWHKDSGKMYFGHIFLIGIQKLRVLARAAGFRIKSVHRVKASASSLILGIFYPIIATANLYAYWRNLLRDDGIDKSEKRRVYGEILRWNLHPTILFGRHLFVEFEKISDTGATELYVNRRG